MESDLRVRRFFLFLMIAASALLGAILYPLASALFLAAVLAGVLDPLQQRLARGLRNRRSVTAVLLVLGMVLVVVGPFAAFSAFVVKEGAAGVKFVQDTVASEGVTGLIEHLPDPVQRIATEALGRLSQETGGGGQLIQNQIEQRGAKAAAAVGAVLSATSSFLFQMAMMLIALFFLLVQGDDFVTWLDDVSPLRKGQTRELFTEIRKVSYAVIMSTVITAAVQTLAALVGYFIARVPHPVFFAAALLLWVTGHPYAALFLAIWGLAVVGLVDNLVKPLLIRGGMELHGAVVFFSLIGGLAVFGTIGLLVGPLAVALFLALLKMYRRDFAVDAP